MVQIGHDLQVVQAKLPHGHFLPWLEQEFGWSKSMAYNLLNLAAKFPTVGNLPANLSLSALYQLTATTTPDSALTEAQERAAHGETISKAAAREIATRHRQAYTSTTQPVHTNTPPRPLTAQEAQAVIWRVIIKDAPMTPQDRLAWLNRAPIQFFTIALQPSVSLSDTIFHQATQVVARELTQMVDKSSAISAATLPTQPPPLEPTCVGSQSQLPEPIRIPNYLAAAGASVTSDAAGQLVARLGNAIQQFPPDALNEIVTWLDTQLHAQRLPYGPATSTQSAPALALRKALPHLYHARTDLERSGRDSEALTTAIHAILELANALEQEASP